MTKSPLPNLEEVRTLPGTWRFLAAVGAAVSLSAALELLYFDLFVAATGEDAQSLAEDFYRHGSESGARGHTKASTRRKFMHKAVSPTLSVSELAEWSSLHARLKRWTGEDCLRHFVAHTPVTFVAGDYSDDFSADDYVVDELVAVQDALHAMANGVSPRTEDFDSTMAYCRELEAIYADLSQFLSRYQAAVR